MIVALTSIDDIIKIVKQSKSTEEAKNAISNQAWPAEEVEEFIALIDDPGHEVIDGKYKLSNEQIKSILELRLQKLTGLEREKLTDEINEIAGRITEYLNILTSTEKVNEVVLEEFASVKERLSDKRRTEISDDGDADQDDESLIQHQNMLVTITQNDHIKRKPIKRKKLSGDDKLKMEFVADTHSLLLFFTSKGKVHQIKCYRLPEVIGKTMHDVLPLKSDEKVSAIIPMPNNEDEWKNLLFVTGSGKLRRNNLNEFFKVKRNGKFAIRMPIEDELVDVIHCDPEDKVRMKTKDGKDEVFDVSQVRLQSERNNNGVRIIKLGSDRVVSLKIDTE